MPSINAQPYNTPFNRSLVQTEQDLDFKDALLHDTNVINESIVRFNDNRMRTNYSPVNSIIQFAKPEAPPNKVGL